MGGKFAMPCHVLAPCIPAPLRPSCTPPRLAAPTAVLAHACARAVCVVVAAYIHWRAVRLMLEWRDASGGCAAPITSGPLEVRAARVCMGVGGVRRRGRAHAFALKQAWLRAGCCSDATALHMLASAVHCGARPQLTHRACLRVCTPQGVLQELGHELLHIDQVRLAGPASQS